MRNGVWVLLVSSTVAAACLSESDATSSGALGTSSASVAFESGRSALEVEAKSAPAVLPDGSPYDHVAAMSAAFASDEVVDALRDNPDFAGVRMSGETVIVAWRGDNRTPLEPILAAAAAAGVALKVEDAAYGERELAEALAKLPADPTVPNAGLAGAPFGNGVKIFVFSRESRLLDMSMEDVQAVLDFPYPVLRVEFLGGGIPLIQSRNLDTGSLDGG